jgi:hypothetical protein
MFDFLPQLNPSGNQSVRLSSVAYDGGTVIITGSTAAFETLDNFINVLVMSRIRYALSKDSDVQLPQPLFKSVLVTSSSLTQSEDRSEVSFTIAVVFDPNVFGSNTVIYSPVIAPGEIDSGQPLFKGAT